VGNGDSGVIHIVDDAGCGSIEKTAELERAPVDIIIALDTSGSMADKICSVSKNLTTFADGVGMSTHVITDYTMGILGVETALLCGGQDPLAATALAKDPARYLNVPTNIDSWSALKVLLADFDKYKGFLRPDAPTHFVVVTDDQSNMAGADFKTQMEAKLGHPFYFHSIVSDGIGSSCSGTNNGTEYKSLSDATGGLKLCVSASDWTALFKQLEEAVVASAPLPCDFDIPPPPDGKEFDATKVQVRYKPADGNATEFPLASSADKCGDNTAWYYDDPTKPKKIEFCSKACDTVKSGGSVGIAFGCAPAQVIY
jgi:hypothetical protein